MPAREQAAARTIEGKKIADFDADKKFRLEAERKPRQALHYQVLHSHPRLSFRFHSIPRHLHLPLAKKNSCTRPASVHYLHLVLLNLPKSPMDSLAFPKRA
jgi:hypothetical protein